MLLCNQSQSRTDIARTFQRTKGQAVAEVCICLQFFSPAHAHPPSLALLHSMRRLLTVRHNARVQIGGVITVAPEVHTNARASWLGAILQNTEERYGPNAGIWSK